MNNANDIIGNQSCNMVLLSVCKEANYNNTLLLKDIRFILDTMKSEHVIISRCAPLEQTGLCLPNVFNSFLVL